MLYETANSYANTPDFTPILHSMETAISNDPFWSPMHYPHLLARSTQVADGLHDLRQQCHELTILVTSPLDSSSSDDSDSFPLSPRYHGGGRPLLLRNPPATLIPVKHGALARQQMRMREEELEAMTGLLRSWMLLQESSRRSQRGFGRVNSTARLN